jgi:hypothetical protein
MISECYDKVYPEQLMLSIDYSRAALTAVLIFEDCGVLRDRRVLHDTRLGTDGLQNSEANRNDLSHAIRTIASLPLKDGDGVGKTRIENLALIGEDAGNSQLNKILKEVLGNSIPLKVVRNALVCLTPLQGMLHTGAGNS